MDDPSGRGNGVKLGSSRTEQTVEKLPRKKQIIKDYTNRHRTLPPPPPQPAVRTERLPSFNSEIG